MRLDHIAYRVANKEKTAAFFKKAFGYKEQCVFDLEFDDGTKCECIALEPPEKVENALWTWVTVPNGGKNNLKEPCCYHMAPEIFVSEGQPDSIVGKWVAERNGIGGIHHIAYQVDDVEATMEEWKEKGYAEFCSEKPLTCPGLTQVFTKPSELTGVIYEFIKRENQGFCKDNVKSLMESTKEEVKDV